MYNIFVCLQVTTFFTSTLLHSTLFKKDVKSVLKKNNNKSGKKENSVVVDLAHATMHTADSYSLSKVLNHFYKDFPHLFLYPSKSFFLQ